MCGLTCKTKQPNWQIPTAPEQGCKHMGGEAASPTNPNKGRAQKRKINM